MAVAHIFPPMSPDSSYFDQFRWVLSPAPTLEEQRIHVQGLIDSLHHEVPAWQCEETWINLYLLLCGLHCTASDYLTYQRWPTPWPPARRTLPRTLATFAFRLASRLHRCSVAHELRRVLAWRRPLERCLETVCEQLLVRKDGGLGSVEAIRAELNAILNEKLPRRALQWRLRIPEAFRCQDFTHHDIIEMARRGADFLKCKAGGSVFVIGPRTAGAYFAPLAHASLRRSQLTTLGWLTVRPKEGLTTAERHTIRTLARSADHVVIVDDHPNTGRTFALLLGVLRQLGVEPHRITILAPEHAVQSNWRQMVGPSNVVTLPVDAFYKTRLVLDDARLLQVLHGLMDAHAYPLLRLHTPAGLQRINRELESRYGDSFQVRLKRVFELESGPTAANTLRSTVVAKSVGWGWLGYHAAIASTSLQGFVPRLLGLRDGMIFMEWLGDEAWPPSPPASAQIAERVPAYIALRAATLNIGADPTTSLGYRFSGRDKILHELSQALGPYRRRLLRPDLRRRLAAYVALTPTLVDGRMSLDNWVAAADDIFKVDFEHHNFGGGEQDLVDPVYDLAGAVFELALEPPAERQLVAQYCQITGERDVEGRLLLYKYLVGILAMQRAANVLRRTDTRHRYAEMNERFLRGRNFLTFQFNLHHSQRMDVRPADAWSTRLVMMDLDGVFDVQRLGFFPHTTTMGLTALRKLQLSGYSVVPNTARGTEHAVNYCRSYGLAGAIAEYGCVLIDHTTNRELYLVDEAARDRIADCRTQLGTFSNVYCDPGYRCIIRAYRYEDGRWRGLLMEQIERVLKTAGPENVEAIRFDADTFFVPKGVNKGSGLRAALRCLDLRPTFLAAIGDSMLDLEMLEQADWAFIPANGSKVLREALRKKEHVRIMRGHYQRGLLQAADEILKHPGARSNSLGQVPARIVKPASHVIDWVLDQSETGPLPGR